jgi:hypothetical protein
LCRQYEDLPTAIQSSADLSCVNATHAFFHLMKGAKDPLYEQMLDNDYKFPFMEQLSQVTSRSPLLCKKYFNQYWNMGDRENAFLKEKKKMEKVGLRVLLSLFLLLFLFSLCVYLVFGFFTNNLFSFCSSLRKKLSLMRRCKESKTNTKRKMPEMMMLLIIHFSCLCS